MSAIKHIERIGKCTLILGDSRDILTELGRFDAVVTDPPYGIGYDKEAHKKSGQKFGGSKVARTEYEDTDWDSKPPSDADIQRLMNISKYQILFGGNYFDGLPATRCWLVWDKLNGSTSFADFEMAWTNLDTSCRKIEWLWNGMLRQGQANTKQRDKRRHPTEKPVGVMRWALEILPKDARTIVDPYMGSGSILVAGVQLGLSCFGIEREQAYFDIACERVRKAYTETSDMFVAQHSRKTNGEQAGFDL